MATTESERQPPEVQVQADDVQNDQENDPESARGRLSGAVGVARTSVTTLIDRVPGTVRATRAGARRTTSALQRLPDSTLGWLTAVSVGLAAGLKLAGAPRLVAAAGAAPALIIGAAIALRQDEPVVPVTRHADESAGGVIDMADEHTKGAISKAEGKVEEGLGKLTGDREKQAHGKAKQVQGVAQKTLGDVQDAIRGPKDKARA
jgi:uncharacterized protein YjbJ (UPF0337 family)